MVRARSTAGSASSALASVIASAMLLALPWLPATAQTATVRGSLIDRGTRLPVEGARVSVLGTTLGVSTDLGGRFQLEGVPSGVRVVQIRAIGYAVGSWMVELGDGQVLQQTLELDRRLVMLDTVTVAADEAPTGWRSEAGFESRRARRDGFFLNREEIQQRQARTISDLLRLVPGVMTTCGSRSCQVRMNRGTRPCSPEFFLDGYPATFATGPDFPIQQIRGVEVYRNAFEAPAEFQRPNLQCGVIALWTIEPGTPLERR